MSDFARSSSMSKISSLTRSSQVSAGVNPQRGVFAARQAIGSAGDLRLAMCTVFHGLLSFAVETA